MNKKIFESVLDNKLSVIASRPMCGKMNMLLYILEEFGINQKKRINLFNLDANNTWYTINLISLLSELSKEEIHYCFYPCNKESKGKQGIDRDKFVDTIETLRKSNIYMCDFNFILDENTDIIDYILEEEIELKPGDFIIINSFDELVQKSKYPIEEILLKLYYCAKYEVCHIIILSNVKREAEERKRPKLTDINFYHDLKDFVDNFILSWKEFPDKEEITYKISNREEYSTYKFKYNFFNNKIVEEENEL